MAQSSKVVTVLGEMDPSELGITLPHEHLFRDDSTEFSWPASAHKRGIARRDVKLEDLWYVRRNPMRHLGSRRMNSTEEAISEVEHFRRAGGETLVDVSPRNTGIDPEEVQRIARTTGLNIIHGTAYYSEYTHPSRLEDASAADIAADFISDIEKGIGDTDVRAGIIGEIGVSKMSDQELKVVRGGAIAAQETGAALSIHPPLHYESSPSHHSHDILDVVEEEGLDPSRVIMCHQDYCDEIDHPEPIQQLKLAERGANIEFDLWGWEMFIKSEDHASPSDNWRARATKRLLAEGHADRILFSHDICTNAQRRRYGGFGYSHILDNVVPMLRSHGVQQDTLDKILIKNPQSVLSFD